MLQQYVMYANYAWTNDLRKQCNVALLSIKVNEEGKIKTFDIGANSMNPWTQPALRQQARQEELV